MFEDNGEELNIGAVMGTSSDLHAPVNLNKSLEEMTPDEKLRYEHQMRHEKHKGHEEMHTIMVLILFVVVAVAQVIFIRLKKSNHRSYSIVSLLAIWTIPIGISIFYGFVRLIIVWSVFSLITAFIIRRAINKPIARTTPSYGMGLIGYLIMVCTFLGVNYLFNQDPSVWLDTGVMLAFYGLYIGVLGRDISGLCSEKMAVLIGYYTPQGIPTRHLEEDVCAVCGNQFLVRVKEEGILENTYKLSCNHVFHEFCIRGWCIVGKKQTCPYCNEKVDLKRMFSNPWERTDVAYGRFLDCITFLVAWMPLIFFFVQGINWVLGLE